MNLETKIKDAFSRHETDVQTRPGAWSEVERRVAQSHKRRIAASALGAALAIVAAALVVPRIGREARPTRSATNPPTTTATASPTQQGKIPVRAFQLDASKDTLWGLVLVASSAENKKAGQLVRIDPASQKVVARVDVGYAPRGLAVDSDTVWVANASGCDVVVYCGDASSPPTFSFPEQNSVMRIDARANRVVASVPVEDPQDVDLAFGSVWVTAGEGSAGAQLIRIDAGTGRRIATIRLGALGGSFAPLTHDDRNVWSVVPDETDRFDKFLYKVMRIDPATNTATHTSTIEVSGSSTTITSGFGSIWTTVSGTTSASALARIDPTSGQIIKMFELPDAAPVGLTAITTGNGFVWTTSARGSLWQIDAETNQPIGEPMIIGDPAPVGANDVVVLDGSVWVASGDGNVYRIEP